MLQDIAILTGGTVVSEDLGQKLENIDTKALGQRQAHRHHEGRHDGHRGQGQVRGHQGPRAADPDADRGDLLGLRPREAAGAPRQARRRRRHHQGRCSHRDRDEGEEGPRRGRHARHEGGRGGGHRRRRRHRAAPRHRCAQEASTPTATCCSGVEHRVKRALEGAAPPASPQNAGEEGSMVVAQASATTSQGPEEQHNVGLRGSASRKYCRSRPRRHHRPGQGRPLRHPERRFHRRHLLTTEALVWEVPEEKEAPSGGPEAGMGGMGGMY